MGLPVTSSNRILISLCAVAFAFPVRAQTGVSNDRVSLPDGPGSVEGIGDNAEVNLAMGQMAYSYPVELPRGFSGVTPELAFAYSSGSGAGLLGVGWSVEFPAIER